MKVRLHIDQHTDHDEDITKLFEAAKASKPENRKFYDDEEAAGRQAIEAAAKKIKNNKFIIHHGGSYTTIGVASQNSSRLAIITFAPGQDEEPEEVKEETPEDLPFGKEWEKEMDSIPIGGLEAMFDITKGKKKLKPAFITRIGKMLEAQATAENLAKGTEEE